MDGLQNPGAYGSGLGGIFKLDRAPTFVNRDLKAGMLAVTETRDDSPVATHIAVEFGGLAPRSRPARGCLSAWQERRAKEMLTAHLDGEMQLADLACECGVSTSHFRRAFRASTGMAPHQWLLHRRVDAAKAALRDPRQPLAEVALACGFADQSHFTRFEGISPGRWRSAHDLTSDKEQ